MNTATDINLIYAMKGTTAIINDERGTIVEMHYSRLGMDSRLAGVFVRLDDRPAMLYVNVGERVAGPCDCYAQFEEGPHNPQCRSLRDPEASHNLWRERLDVSEITRDDFDEITGLAATRRGMGWTL